ncbi:MAG: hypothetical protein DME80_12830 [Verrucomicrobia bacterium]|nr:MAG: hypothetical protein DMC60_07805 [Verrucomicrobiota bacterium]PYJ27954.1 MAG: hypothetical protein DME89_07665 [Verrucomicrobiota bacterium]PYJ41932.1 MAG: hypothetical protein DME80_12830 [Verrucomicrobiota bacterium]
MSVGTAFLGSARLQRAGDGILPSRTLLGAHTRRKLARNESSFRRNAEINTPEACAPQSKELRPRRTFRP